MRRFCISSVFLAVVVLTSSGCAMLEQVQRCNFACKPVCGPNHAQCHQDCNTCSKVDPHVDQVSHLDDGFANGDAMSAMHVAFAEQLELLQEKLDALSEMDASLQEQLAMMDRKTEKHGQEQQDLSESVNRLSQQMAGTEIHLKRHDVDLDAVESNLVQQHALCDAVLTSVEKKLGVLLNETGKQ